MFRENTIRMSKCIGKVFHGKRFDWTARKVKNHIVVYRRETDLDKWQMYGKLVEVDGIIFTNYVGSCYKRKEE